MLIDNRDRLLIEPWTCNLFQKLRGNDSKSEEDLSVSKFGLKLWDEHLSLKIEDRSEIISETINEKEIINAIETSSIPEDNRIARARKVNQKPAKLLPKDLFETLRNPKANPYLQIEPYAFAELEEDGSEIQPFRVIVHPQVGLLTDFHSHLSDAEIIGYLAGKWDPNEKILYVQVAVPCLAEDNLDGGYTDVEMDAVASWEAKTEIENMGLNVIGWYHSHPSFNPHPSVTDLRNQRSQQKLYLDETCNVEPYIGLIVSTFDNATHQAQSMHQWFYTADFTRDKKTVGMPVKLEVEYAMPISKNNDKRKSVCFIEIDEQESLMHSFQLFTPVFNHSFESTVAADGEPTPEDMNGLVANNEVSEHVEGEVCQSNVLNSNDPDEIIVLSQTERESNEVQSQLNMDADMVEPSAITDDSISGNKDSVGISQVLPSSYDSTESLINGHLNRMQVGNVLIQDTTNEKICEISKKLNDPIYSETAANNLFSNQVHSFAPDLNQIVTPSESNINKELLEILVSQNENKIDEILHKNDEISKINVKNVKIKKIMVKKSQNNEVKRTYKKRKEKVMNSKVDTDDVITTVRATRPVKKRSFFGEFVDPDKIDSSVFEMKLPRGEKETYYSKKKKQMENENQSVHFCGGCHTICLLLNREGKMMSECCESLEIEIINQKSNKSKMITKTKKITTSKLKTSKPSKVSTYSSNADDWKGPPILITFLKDSTRKSSNVARKWIFSVVPALRGMTLSMISLCCYYRSKKSKINLFKKWHGNLYRLDKMKESLYYWIDKMAKAYHNNNNNLDGSNGIEDTAVRDFKLYHKKMMDFVVVVWREDPYSVKDNDD